MKIIAPVREWKMSRDEEIAFAAKHGIPVEATKESPYSIDLNLWGRSCEAGVLEDPWDEPPADAFAWTVDPAKAPERAGSTSPSISSMAGRSPSTARNWMACR